MSATLLSTLTPNYPVNMERWPGGPIYFSNGVDPVYKWNGYHSTAVAVGVETPGAGTPTITGSGVGTISGTYQIYQRYVDEDGNVSPLSTASAVTTITTNDTLTYAVLPAPVGSNVVKRQILRNTDGQFSVFYVDYETTDLVSTSGFTSTKTDDVLAAQTAVPLFDIEGTSLTDIWTAPRADKPIVVAHKGKLFACGEAAYTIGSISLTNGSTTVTGIGTSWSSSMAGRDLWITGETTTYSISSVSTTNQTLTLSAAFSGTTNLFAVYAIRPASAQRNAVSHTVTGEPEQWPPNAVFTIRDIKNSITAAIPSPGFVYFADEKETAQFSFDSNPATDGSAYICATRGCINQRTWVRVLDDVYILDAAGIYALRGAETQEISGQIDDIWSAEADGEFKIAWESKRWFHAVHDREDCTVRFFVSMSGPGYPRHAICVDYVKQQWWIEEYPFAVSSSAAWQSVRHHVLCGGLGPRLLEHGIGTLDGPNPQGYRTLGTVASSTFTSLTDTYLSLPSSGVTGSPIVIVAGRGKGQLRIIDSVSSTRINITQPWLTLPDTTSKYQVGGIQWRVKTGWFRYPKQPQTREVAVAFKPIGSWNTGFPSDPTYDPNKRASWIAGSGYMDVRIYYDHSTVPDVMKDTFPIGQASEDGISWTTNDPNVVVDLSRQYGHIQFTMPTGDSEMNRKGNYAALEMRGTSGVSPTLLYEVRWGGATK